MNSSPINGHLDKLSIGLSTLCAIHCLVLPIIASVLPALVATQAGHDHFHIIMLVLVLPLSGLALGTGWLRHRDHAVMVLALCGLSLLVFAAAMGHDTLGHYGERAATLTGSFILASGHLRNFRQCRPADGCHKGAC